MLLRRACGAATTCVGRGPCVRRSLLIGSARSAVERPRQVVWNGSHHQLHQWQRQGLHCRSAASTTGIPTLGLRRDPRDAVVKIFNTRQRPGWTVPWQTQPVESSTGSGAVILQGDTRMILTAAHVIADSRYVQIQRSTDRFSSEKYRAHVIAVCHEIDLALLTLEDPGALDEVTPLTLASAEELPRVFDKVHVVGYPVGGDAVSVTEGVVSRVEVQEYSHSLRPGLALTVDAAINSGNSGGPLLDGTTANIVGVAFQKLVARGVELQGHAVPAPMIQRFLREATEHSCLAPPAGVDSEAASASSPSTGKPVPATVRLRMPSLGWDFQPLEPPALRRALGLDGVGHGVLVNRLHYVDKAPEVQVGDVMLSFNGLDIDDLGFCELYGRRLHFAAARDLCTTGSNVELRIWRDRQEMTLKHRLPPTRHLVPRGQYDTAPSFFMCGGVVFQALTHEYLMGWSTMERPPHLQNLFLRGHLTPERREAVMVSQILADEVNAGYDSGWVGAPIVLSVNGEAVRDLAHLVDTVGEARKHGNGFLNFLVEMAGGCYRLVLPVQGLDEADVRVQRMYGLPDVGFQGRLGWS